MKIISTNVTIGKSKAVVSYHFRSDDFIRIEGEELILRSESRTLRLPPEEIKSIINQVNEAPE